jgi:hypothetical protein
MASSGLSRGEALVRTGFFIFLRNVRRLLAISNIVPSSPILITLMMEGLSPSEYSVLTRAIPHNIQEDAIRRVVQILVNGRNPKPSNPKIYLSQTQHS